MVELLSPAGDMEKLKLAVLNGADAVYMAGKKFGARAFSKNFDEDEILEAINYCHLYGVKIYITINTIVYEDEIDEFMEYVGFLYNNNVDAVIIQDLGMADLIHKKFPNLILHASTQMNIHTINGLKLLKSLGFKRVVLAREVDLQTIIQMKKEVDIELEVFIHGALCISCSGNCYHSYFKTGRSANRGMCAQMCRLKYDLYKDDKKINIKDKYLLSPKDLCTVNKLDNLINSGIDSLKIEGRMKSKEYVGIVTRVYRNKIDHNVVNNDDIIRIKKVYNRGFTLGNLFNKKGHDFINGSRPNHMGIYLGKVISSSMNKVKIKLENEVNQGDAIRFVLDNKDIGFYLNKIYKNNLLVNGAKTGEIIEVETKEKIKKDILVYKTIDIKTNEYIISSSKKKILLTGYFKTKNDKIIFEFTDNNIKEKIIINNSVFDAKNKPTTKEEIKEKLNKLGNSIYEFKKLDIEIENNKFIPMTTINIIKRDMIEIINKKRTEKVIDSISKEYKFNKIDINITNDISFEIKNEKQLEYILNNTNYLIYTENKPLYTKYIDNNRVIYKMPRISRINKLLNNVFITDIDYINSNCISDVFLNVANSYYVRLLHEKNIKKISLSYELSNDQIKLLIKNYKKRYNDIPNLELIVYGRSELMVSKYDLFNTYSLKGDNYYLADLYNNKFPIFIENDYLKILNCECVNNIDKIDYYKSIGITNFKIVLNNESIDELNDIIMTLKKI